MLTQHQIDHFRTFGFVALPGFLGAARAEALRAEVDTALHDAYAATYDERPEGDGISGHYLPMASRLTPVSASFVSDDPLFIEAAGDLLGTPVLPSLPEGVLYFAAAGWHDDDGIGVKGVKFATYFGHLSAGNGALCFVPCSHHNEDRPRLRSYQRAYDDFPGVVVKSQPGDVVAFDLHTFHASFGGHDRLAWAIEYLAVPNDEGSRKKVLAWMEDDFEQAFRGFDRARYPAWRDFLAGADQSARREEVIARMRSAGVLDLRGAELGW